MIMMCLIMDAHPSEDVSVHIQHTLIEAYCFEQDIHLLKVQLSTPYSST
jgi:growth arrest and DNA-damage-inducible protein